MKVIKLNITGMTCAVCASRIEKAVMEAGAKRIDVSVTGNYAKIAFDEGVLSEEMLINAIKKAGYGAFSGDGTQHKEKRNFPWRLIAGIVISAVIMYLSMGHMLSLPQLPPFYSHSIESALLQGVLALMLSAVFYKYYTVGFKNLFKGSPTMDSLIALGSTAALLYSGVTVVLAVTGDSDLSHGLYFESSAMILTLVYLGKTLEDRAKSKTRNSLSALLSIAPETACVIRDGREITVFASELRSGDIAVVRSGDSIPADGTVIEGEAVIDESCLTGESYGVEKTVGSSVSGATVCSNGYFKFRVERVGEETSFAKIISMVEDAAASKAPIARLADKVASVFVPAVITVSALTFVVWMLVTWLSGGSPNASVAFRCAISVLVISCPCALGLATPTAITCAVGKGASMGIFVKDAESIEKANKIDTVVFDKTGTLTEGGLRLVNTVTYGIEKERALEIAAAVESGSTHPVAQALTKAYSDLRSGCTDNCPADKSLMIGNFKEHSGRGASADIEGKSYVCANLRMMNELGVRLPEDSQSDGYMKAYLSENGTLIAVFSFFDMPKKESADAVLALKNQGKRVMMLTGDNAFSAEKTAAQIGISPCDVVSQVLPDGKGQVISSLQKQGFRVAMVGDGINDAPSLTVSDLGVAMGQGKDAAIECADIVLLFSRVSDLPVAFALFSKTYKIIKQNLFWALIYNALCIPVAAGVLYPLGILLSPMLGAAAMSFSSVFVVSNALRLTRFTYKNTEGVTQNTEVNDDIKTNTNTNTDEKGENEMFGKKQEIVLSVEGMMCNKCAAHVEEAVKKLSGVKKVNVSLEEKKVSVLCKEGIDEELIRKAITDAGYTVK